MPITVRTLLHTQILDVELMIVFPTVWERPNFHSSPAISRSLAACLDVSDLSENEIDIFDFYSYVDKGTIS